MTGPSEPDTLLDQSPEARLAVALKALSVVRHDLRNMLASVQIMTNRMAESDDERLARGGPLLRESMERLLTLGVIGGELAAADRATPEAVPVATLLAEAGLAPSEAETGLLVMAAPQQLGTILNALHRNATTLGGGTDEPVHVQAARQGDAVVVTVTCETGVAPFVAESLFTPFEGAKRRGGTGLGLPLARKLAWLNGGSLELADGAEEKAVFVLTLPAA